MIRIHLGTGPRRVTESKTGTRDLGRKQALAYMWQIHMQTVPRMDTEVAKHQARLLIFELLSKNSRKVVAEIWNVLVVFNH